MGSGDGTQRISRTDNIGSTRLWVIIGKMNVRSDLGLAVEGLSYGVDGALSLFGQRIDLAGDLGDDLLLLHLVSRTVFAAQAFDGSGQTGDLGLGWMIATRGGDLGAQARIFTLQLFQFQAHGFDLLGHKADILT